MADLSQNEYRIKETATLSLTGPKGQETDIKIEVFGRDSDYFVDAHAKMRTEIREATAENQIEEGTKEDVAIRREAITNLLVRITIDWENIAYQGEELPYTDANARKLYMDPELTWLRNQVYDFAVERKHFLGN